MPYELIINGNTVYGGTALETYSICVVLLIILFFIIYYVRHKITKNDVLKYEFITIIAHKFRTPLTSVKWLIETMVKTETDSYKKQNLEDMRLSNQKLIDLTGTMIELTDGRDAGKSSYVFERLPLCSIVKSVSEALKYSFHEKNIFFSVNCSDPEIFVKADKNRLEFVIQTILENARAYTQTGGNVDVSISLIHKKSIITIKDNGIGMDKTALEQIFGKFYRAPNAKITDTEGFGVGLYLARSIVKHFHGKIEVFSEGLNNGSTFTIILPRVR